MVHCDVDILKQTARAQSIYREVFDTVFVLFIKSNLKNVLYSRIDRSCVRTVPYALPDPWLPPPLVS